MVAELRFDDDFFDSLVWEEPWAVARRGGAERVTGAGEDSRTSESLEASLNSSEKVEVWKSLSSAEGRAAATGIAGAAARAADEIVTRREMQMGNQFARAVFSTG